MITKSINETMEELEEETKYIMVDGKPVTIRRVIDQILGKDEKKKRKLGVDV